MTAPLTAYAAQDPEGHIVLLTIRSTETDARNRLIYFWGERHYEVIGWKVVKVEIKQVES